jgi:hypothetical protein
VTLFNRVDEQHLEAARGYTELRMYLDAHAELESMSPEVRTSREVLGLKVAIFRALEKWDLLQVVARNLALREQAELAWTLAWAEATRHAVSVEAARQIFIIAASSQPQVAAFHYGLARFECLLGDVEAAKSHLKRATEMAGSFRLLALASRTFVRCGTAYKPAPSRGFRLPIHPYVRCARDRPRHL